MIYESNPIYRSLANEYAKTLLRPSNVYTIDNPDILVLNDGGLWGIYIPTKAEIEDFGLMIRRVMSSRLAYSSDLRTVLALTSELPREHERIVNEHFSRVCSPDDNLIAIIRSHQGVNNTSVFAPGVRQTFSERVFAYEDYSYKDFESLYSGFRKCEGGVLYSEKVDAWGENLRKRSSKSLFSLEKGLFGNKKIPNGKFKDSCESLMTLGFFRDTNYDNGNITINEEWGFEPVGLNLDMDVSKLSSVYKRSLMFQGIMPVSIGEIEMLPSIFDTLCTIREQHNR